MPPAPIGTKPSSTLRPDNTPARGLPTAMPTDVKPTTMLVHDSLHCGFCDSPSMYTVARMNATRNVKKAMPMTANVRGRDPHSVRRLSTSGW